MENLLNGDYAGQSSDIGDVDSCAEYFGGWLKPKEADDYFKRFLKDIPWESDVLTIFGRQIVTSRKVAWYGDEPFDYAYSGNTRTALPWTDDLYRLREMVSMETGAQFNSCLLNLYHDGSEGMGWHSDDEKELVKDAVIASVSLGADRPFFFKNKETKKKVEVLLEHGSLLVMSGAVQRHWLHSLPKRKKILEPRINLTFRKMKKMNRP